jgi:hypothetical protein
MSFPRYFAKRTPFKIIQKQRSWFMTMIAFFLRISDALHITSIRDFNRYITTIGRTIYGSDQWSMDMEPTTTLIHELCHVMLWVCHGVKYPLRFLVSKKWRARYESICVQAEMLAFDRRYDQGMVEYRAQHFVPYGIPLKVMIREINTRCAEIESNAPKATAVIVAARLKSWQQETT